MKKILLIPNISLITFAPVLTLTTGCKNNDKPETDDPVIINVDHYLRSIGADGPYIRSYNEPNPYGGDYFLADTLYEFHFDLTLIKKRSLFHRA